MAKLARDVMTANPACCTPETPLEQVAKLMIQHDCGEIPVIDSAEQVVGVVTDRDIVCRMVAQGKNPLAYTAEICMSDPVITVLRRTRPLRGLRNDGEAPDPPPAGRRQRGPMRRHDFPERRGVDRRRASGGRAGSRNFARHRSDLALTGGCDADVDSVDSGRRRTGGGRIRPAERIGPTRPGTVRAGSPVRLPARPA